MEEARFIFELVDGSASKPVGGGAAGAQAGSGTGEASKPTGAGERLEDRQQAAKGGSKPQTTPTPTPPASSTPKAPPLPSQPQGPQTGPTAFQVAKDLTGAIPGRFGADAYRMLMSTEAALDRFGRIADLFKAPATVPTAPPQPTADNRTQPPPTASSEAPPAPKAPAGDSRPAAPKLNIEEPAPWEDRSVFQTLDEKAAAQRVALRNAAKAANAQFNLAGVKAVGGIAGPNVPMGTAAIPPATAAASTAPATATAAAAGVGMAVAGYAAIPLAFHAAQAALVLSARSILNDRAERFASLSAPVAQARATNEVARTLQDLRLSREFGGNIADFSRATGRFERAINEMSTRFAGNLSPIVTKLTNAVAALAETAQPYVAGGSAAAGTALDMQFGRALDVLNKLVPGLKPDYGENVFMWLSKQEHLKVPGWDGTEEKVFNQIGAEGAAMAGLKL